MDSHMVKNPQILPHDLPEKNRQVQGSRELGKGPHLHGAQLPRAAAIQRSKGRWDQGTTAESSLGGLKRLKAGDLGQITVKWWSKVRTCKDFVGIKILLNDVSYLFSAVKSNYS